MLKKHFHEKIIDEIFARLPNGYYLCRVKLIIQKIMNKEKKEILSQIVSERIKIKSQLKLLGYFAEKSRFHEREINYLLDRLSYLNELEERVKKMK